jgi:hypothetical protein
MADFENQNEYLCVVNIGDDTVVSDAVAPFTSMVASEAFAEQAGV